MICALALECFCYLYQRSAGDGKVVYNQAILTLYMAYDMLYVGLLIMCIARFIPNGHRQP